MINDNPYLKDLSKIRLKQFRTPEALIAAQFNMTAREFKKSQAFVEARSKNEKRDIPIANFIENIKRQGLWGYVDLDTSIIHFWTNGKCSFELLMEFIAHEIGHRTGKTQRSNLMEECKADSYAQVAVAAYKLAIKLKNK